MLMEKRLGVKGNSDPKKVLESFQAKNKTENESFHFPNSEQLQAPGEPKRDLGREDHSLQLFVLFKIKMQTKFCLAFY